MNIKKLRARIKELTNKEQSTEDQNLRFIIHTEIMGCLHQLKLLEKAKEGNQYVHN